MICYRDRTFCSAKCEKQGDCKDSKNFAIKEMRNSHDDFIKHVMPLAVSDYSDTCDNYKPSEERT